MSNHWVNALRPKTMSMYIPFKLFTYMSSDVFSVPSYVRFSIHYYQHIRYCITNYSTHSFSNVSKVKRLTNRIMKRMNYTFNYVLSINRITLNHFSIKIYAENSFFLEDDSRLNLNEFRMSR